MRPRPLRLAALALLLPLAAARAQTDGPVILDMDTVRHRPTEVAGKDGKKVPAATALLVEGKFGKAVQFSFGAEARGGWMTASVATSPAWAQAEGFSFWVKGDGSPSWGGLEFIDRSDFKLRYAYCFPIESKDWTKIAVPWDDLLPELAGPPVGLDDGRYSPIRFGNLWFGKWYYWRDFPAHRYAIDQIALEQKIERPALPPVSPGLARVRAKLAARQPITLVTMGDSLTDTRHWANRQTVWASLLAKALEDKHGSKVTLVNPAMGGTTLTQNLILMPRWVRDTPSPDLVTLWFGFNDWDSGVRGERFAQYLRLAVDRIRRLTKGSADILIMTTCPAHARWETMRELEQAAATVAKEKQVAMADVAAAFRAAGSPDAALQQTYWCSDKVHLGAKGHEVAKDAVLKAIEAER